MEDLGGSLVNEAFNLNEDATNSAIKEEIVVKSNSILTITETPISADLFKPRVEEIEFVCLPWLGVLLSILISLLLASIALCVAISCWQAATTGRKAEKELGGDPLEHPAKFPNPMLVESKGQQRLYIN